MNTSQVENSSRRFKPWIRALILFLVLRVFDHWCSLSDKLTLPTSDRASDKYCASGDVPDLHSIYLAFVKSYRPQAYFLLEATSQ